MLKELYARFNELQSKRNLTVLEVLELVFLIIILSCIAFVVLYKTIKRIRSGRQISTNAIIRTLQIANTECNNRLRYLESGVLTDDRPATFLNDLPSCSTASPVLPEIEMATLRHYGRYSVNSSISTEC